MYHRTKFVLVAIFVSYFLSAQETEKPEKFTLNGYLTSMNSVMALDSGTWINDYLFHNRLNLNWFVNDAITMNIELRNRFIYGDQVKLDVNNSYSGTLEKDKGIIDLTSNLAKNRSFILNSSIDRIWIKYTLNKFEATIGRQRINWGQTLVWNPNDIFNTYSFFDFDYPERPGSDAIRLQYYPGNASTAEIAVKSDSTGNITAAGLFRFNKSGYDVQILGGVLNSEDITAGLGWSGNIGNVAFRGEAEYFHPYKNYPDTSGLLFLSLGLDYSFSNSLYLQFEALYSQMPEGINISNFLEFYSGPLSVKNLSFTEYNFFGQLSYPINPLLNGSFAAMYFPEPKGYYMGPTVSYLLADNLDFTVYYQLFSGEFGDKRQTFHLGFLRFKYNF